jgi:UDP-4-keto-D-FucNAc 4-reductase
MSTHLNPTTITPTWCITGSSGFVGRHLGSYLVRQGIQVNCISRHGPQPVGTSLTIVPNYLDTQVLTAAMHGAEVVFHLAARAHVLSESSESPEDAFREANRDSARAVALAARAAGVRRLVMISSIGVHGNCTHGMPFAETDDPEPVEPYAVSKLQGEVEIENVLSSGSTDFTILRPTLVYGPGCPGNFRLLLKLVRDLPIVPLGNMTKVRSLIYVENLCDALRLAAVHPDCSRRKFVLSDGEDLSVAHVCRLLMTAMGKDPRRVINLPTSWLKMLGAIAGKRHVVEKLSAELAVDCSGFRRVTGWNPPSLPRDGLARTAIAFADER